MHAVILVAGKEKKLLPFTEDMHQCLFRMPDGKTLLEDLIEKLVSLRKIKKIVVVVGHKKALVLKELRLIKTKLHLSNIVHIENRDFARTNVIYSLWLARKFLKDPFLLIDGDIVCERELLHELVNSGRRKENLLLIDFAYKLKKRDNKVKVVSNRIVRIGKKVLLTKESKFGRSIGIGMIASGNGAFIRRMDALIKQGKRCLIYEDVFDGLLSEYTFRPVATYGFNWMEVDSIEEFKKINNIFSALDKLKDEAIALGATGTYPIDPQEIVFDPKVKLFCYKCANYGRKCTCPPRIPQIDYRQMVLSYKKGLIVVLKSNIPKNWMRIRVDSTNKLHRILLKLEKYAFKNGYHFANSFIGGSCKLCASCPDKCRMPQMSRIPLEAVGVDVVKTASKVGLNLKFPVEKSFYRVGMLMVG